MEILQNSPILSSLFVMAMLGRSCEGTCGPDQFAVDDSTCCSLCPEGWFVKVNCSRANHNTINGNQCAPCKTCEDGQKMILQCTKFSDTVCEKEVPTAAVTAGTISKTKVFVGELTLYITASVVVILIVMASVCKWYTTRKSPEDPAKEPLKIQHITV